MKNEMRVLFICTGNYYRSRFAEEVFNFYSKDLLPMYQADSSGVKAIESRDKNPGNISKYALEALNRFGVSPIGHEREPKQLIVEQINGSNLSIALSKSEHLSMMQELFPDHAGKIIYWDVEDIGYEEPTIATDRIYRFTLDLIDSIRKGI